ncbi:hypothetical protein AJ78_06705 [Emergomyces pasteurianus Ep9510]|uniref:Uncharacterized protein n=1 Tax=Emergomyces pasteurianus Ep9510 TaxID=1447872 RepID=A0A1J9PXY2_9EURO|nr:hypothetical protein AJ78_06705 [Emergomyces pasteurianus Ep9510]
MFGGKTAEQHEAEKAERYRRAASRAASREPSNTPIPSGFDHRFEPPPPHSSEPQSPPETARKAPPRMAAPEPELVDTPTGTSEGIDDGMVNRGLQIAALCHQLVQHGVPGELASNMAAMSVMEKSSPQLAPGGFNDRVKEFRQQHGHVSLRIDIKLAGHANYESWRRDVGASHILSNYENDPPLQQHSHRESSVSMAPARRSQIHDNDLHMQLIDKICKIFIDDYESDIIAHTKAWQRTFLLELRKDKPKNRFVESNVDDLISELVRHKALINPDTKKEKVKALKAEEKEKEKEKEKKKSKENDKKK